jgi:hypothetical protein
MLGSVVDIVRGLVLWRRRMFWLFFLRSVLGLLGVMFLMVLLGLLWLDMVRRGLVGGVLLFLVRLFSLSQTLVSLSLSVEVLFFGGENKVSEALDIRGFDVGPHTQPVIWGQQGNDCVLKTALWVEEFFDTKPPVIDRGYTDLERLDPDTVKVLNVALKCQGVKSRYV